jgi:hypothetical protein
VLCSNPIDHAKGLSAQEEPDMEALAALVAIIAAIVGIDLMAVLWGADSRPGMTDDHAR